MRAFWKSPLFIAIALGLVTIISRDARDLEHFVQNTWFRYHSEKVPTGAAIVSLDGETRPESSSPVTATAEQAKLVTKLLAAGVDHIYLDFPATAGADPVGDELLRQQVWAARDRVTLVNRGVVTARPAAAMRLTQPRFQPAPGTDVAFSSWSLNFLFTPLSSDATATLGGRQLRAVAAAMNPEVAAPAELYPDFTIARDSVPTVDARGLLTDDSDLSGMAGKKVFVTQTGVNLDTAVNYFGVGKVPMAFVDIATATGMGRGGSDFLWWQPFLLVLVAGVLVGRRVKSRQRRAALYTMVVVIIAVGPLYLRSHGFVTNFGGAQVALVIYGALRGWQKWRERMRTTASGSGLPNIEALSQGGIPPGTDVVAVSVSNYEQMLASLPRELHGECARQIARRLSVAASGSRVYDNDNGHFVWLVQPYALDALIAQFEGLKALFSAPLVIGGHVLDTNVHFGLDRNSANQAINRIRSAIVSSSEAQSKGKLYEEFGQQRLAEAPWELSLNARIDEALRNGDIWLAFQPQLDLRRDRISGAETLIRWTDPERGVIPPDSFIIQAERAGRIDAITYWVLERAIEASGDLGSLVGKDFHLGVNLSAWMVDQPGLVSHVSEIAARTGFDCRKLTFEVTETFSMTNRELAKRNLEDLRAMGFRLSIDDFGTGWASLSYLSEIQTDEIKLDKRFVQAVCHNHRDRAIVRSTIQLAQSLGQVIVAEGVEDLPTLRALRELDCDVAQGYLIGRPVRYDEFVRTLDMLPDRRQSAI